MRWYNWNRQEFGSVVRTVQQVRYSPQQPGVAEGQDVSVGEGTGDLVPRLASWLVHKVNLVHELLYLTSASLCQILWNLQVPVHSFISSAALTHLPLTRACRSAALLPLDSHHLCTQHRTLPSGCASRNRAKHTHPAPETGFPNVDLPVSLGFLQIASEVTGSLESLTRASALRAPAGQCSIRNIKHLDRPHTQPPSYLTKPGPRPPKRPSLRGRS